MPKKRKDPWTDEMLFKVAWMSHVEKLPPDVIAYTKIGKSPSTARKMLKAAERRGIVQTLVVSPVPPKGLEALRHRVREYFDLKDVQLVPGREDLMKDPCPQEKQRDREAMVMLIARAAAQYLESHLGEGDVLAVPWGRMLSYLARQLQPMESLSSLVVVPMEGVMGVEADPVGWSFEANAIAAQIAAAFGGRAWQLPAPAVVDQSGYKELQRHPLVSRALKKMTEATVAIVPVAPIDPENSTVVRMRLLEKERVKRLKERGAIGEIASHWWFDRQGKPLTDEGSYLIGLGLEGLRAMVQQDHQVIAVVGASEQRIEPLWIALRQELVNILITDSVTAQRLWKLG